MLKKTNKRKTICTDREMPRPAIVAAEPYVKLQHELLICRRAKCSHLHLFEYDIVNTFEHWQRFDGLKDALWGLTVVLLDTTCIHGNRGPASIMRFRSPFKPSGYEAMNLQG